MCELEPRCRTTLGRALHIAAALAVVGSSLWQTSAHAMEVKTSLDEIAHTADLVVVATAVDIQCRFNDTETMIFTDVLFDTVELIHAGPRSIQAEASKLRLSYAGGQVGERGVSVSGSPHFELGQRYVLFLLDDGTTYANPLVGGTQALLRVVRDRSDGVQYLLAPSGKAVLGIADGELVLGRYLVREIVDGIVVPDADEASLPAVERRLPVPSDPGAKALPGPDTDTAAAAEHALSVRRFAAALRELLAAPAPSSSRVLRFGPARGRLFETRGDTVVARPLPKLRPTQTAQLPTRWHGATKMGDRTNAGLSGAGDPELLGGTLGYCGYHSLNLVMQQVPEAWWEWAVNNASMWDWNQVMSVFTYIASDGYYGDNSQNEFCAYVDSAHLSSVYGYSWGSAIAMCITWWIGCECCEIVQSDVLWNAAFSWTDNWEFAIGNSSVVYTAPVNMHELGHAWGMQRGPYVETYAYDEPTVMHSYYSNLVENGRGVHRPEAYCMRRLYDDQTGILGTKDIGVESYWAANGLNNAYASATTVHPGDSITLYGVTVENISYTAVSNLRLRFWLSPNRTISTGDTQMGGYWYWTSFTGEAFNVGNYTMTVPSISPGQYYIGAMVTMNGFLGDDYPDNNTSSFFHSLTVLPAAPANLTASDGAYTGRVRISWSPVAGSSGYDVYRRSCASCTAVKVGSTGYNFYDDTSALYPRCTFYYFVRATSPYGDSYDSNQDSGYREFVTPSGLVASDNQASRVLLSWPANDGAVDYGIWRSGCSGPSCIYFPIATTYDTSYEDTAVTPGLDYFYFIRAQNMCASSPNSNIDEGSIALPAPTGVSASDGLYPGLVKISWNAVDHATSYDVWRGTSPANAAPFASSATTSYDDSAVGESTPYYYLVAARSSIGAGTLSDPDMGFGAPTIIFVNGFERGNLEAWSSSSP